MSTIETCNHGKRIVVDPEAGSVVFLDECPLCAQLLAELNAPGRPVPVAA